MEGMYQPFRQPWCLCSSLPAAPSHLLPASQGSLCCSASSSIKKISPSFQNCFWKSLWKLFPLPKRTTTTTTCKQSWLHSCAPPTAECLDLGTDVKENYSSSSKDSCPKTPVFHSSWFHLSYNSHRKNTQEWGDSYLGWLIEKAGSTSVV